MRAASRLGIDMRVIVLPDGFDPDDLIRERPEEWQRLVREAEPVADYAIRVATAGLDAARASVFEKEKIARALLPLLTATESDLHREANVQKLALRLHLSERRLMEIAMESRRAMAPRRTTDSRLRQRGRTAGMDEAARQWKAPEPPPPQAARPASPPTPRDDDWQEGPSLAYDEGMAPPDDEDATDLPDVLVPDGRVPDAAPAYRPRPASMLEGYCLSILLLRPEQLYHIDRELRTAADGVKARFVDARQAHLDHALASFGAEDFHDTGHQAILRALRGALRQDELDALDYVREMVGTAFHAQIDALLTLHQPLDQFQDRLTGPMRSELASVLKQMRREGRVMLGPESELIDKAFQLRRTRLLASTEELRFLVDEAGPDDKRTYQDMIDANEAAITCLDRVLHQRAQLAQE